MFNKGCGPKLSYETKEWAKTKKKGRVVGDHNTPHHTRSNQKPRNTPHFHSPFSHDSVEGIKIKQKDYIHKSINLLDVIGSAHSSIVEIEGL